MKDSLNGPIVKIFFCSKFSHFCEERTKCEIPFPGNPSSNYATFKLAWINLLQDESGRVLGGKHASIQFAYDLNKVVLILYKL